MITYREFAPAPELVGRVRAYFSFTPEAPRSGQRTVTHELQITGDDPFWTPLFADARTSLAVDLGAACQAGKGWSFGQPLGARATGPQRSVGDAVGSRPAMIGVYFEPGATASLLGLPAVELTDHAFSLEEIWGADAAQLVAQIAELDTAARLDRLETALLARMRRASMPATSVDVWGLARWVQSEPRDISVTRLAEAAGVSRRHLTRIFRHVIGVSPKRFCRLARFHAGLRYAGAGPGVKWAQVAAELGYADQSHMIAEFREMSSLTPEALATQRRFHPFILESRSRFGRPAIARP